MKRIIHKKEVAKMIGVHHSTIMRWVEQGIFPKPKKLGKRVISWDLEKLNKFIEDS